MMPISKTEARIINYLYKNKDKELYPAEIVKELNIPKGTAYRSLESLEDKKIVEKVTKGRMKFYKLEENWTEIAEAAKTRILAETDEARAPKSYSDKIAIANDLERFLPLAERAFDAPSLDKLKDALDSMKKEINKEKRK